jgi:two-component system, OmpR family, KDP operon response regulator KdpE
MSGSRLLICDDDPQILHLLTLLLSEAGFEAMPVATGAEALNRAAARPPDAAIIDVLLPDEHGIEVCCRLREWSRMPILMLSAVDEERTKVRALQRGADDYLTKPFAPAELMARLEAALRRADRSPDDSRVVIEGLDVDLAGRTVRAEGREVRLTPIEYDLLRVLVQNPGKLMTHESLLLEVWGPGYDVDRHALRFHVSNLRKKIAPSGQSEQLVRTERGIGYRLAPGTSISVVQEAVSWRKQPRP